MIFKKTIIISIVIFNCFNLRSQCLNNKDRMYPDDYYSLRTNVVFRGNWCNFLKATNEDIIQDRNLNENPDSVFIMIKNNPDDSYWNLVSYKYTYDKKYLPEILELLKSTNNPYTRRGCIDVLGFNNYKPNLVKSIINVNCAEEWLLFASLQPHYFSKREVVNYIDSLVYVNGNIIYQNYFEKINTILSYFDVKTTNDLLFKLVASSEKVIPQVDALICYVQNGNMEYYNIILKKILSNNELTKYETRTISILFIKYNLIDSLNKFEIEDNIFKQNKNNILNQIKQIKNECLEY